MNSLPPVYAITASMLFPSAKDFLERLKIALDGGLGLLQVRDKELDQGQREYLARSCVELCKGYGCRVLINGSVTLAEKIGADGVHVPSRELGDGFSRPAGLVGVSCHDVAQLEKGLCGLDADFAVLSPVARTLTHVDAKPLGWEAFSKMTSNFAKPIYALGGLTLEDVGLAQSKGACGIASMRDIWGLAARPAIEARA